MWNKPPRWRGKGGEPLSHEKDTKWVLLVNPLSGVCCGCMDVRARCVRMDVYVCVCVCACLCTQKKTIHTFLSLSFSSARCRASASFCSCSRLRCASASSCNRFYREGEKNYTQDHESMFLNLVADNFIHAIYKKSIAWKVLYPVCIEWVKVLLFIKQITTIHNSSFTLFVSLSWERYYPRYPF